MATFNVSQFAKMKRFFVNSNFNYIFILLFLTLLIGSAVWTQINSSLWEDEAVTWWIVKDTFADTIDRAIRLSPISPLYFSILWSWTKLFGTSEVALRLPSLFLTLGTIAVLYRLSLRWLDTNGAWLAVIVFVSNFSVSFAMIDARPYALGLFFLSCAWLSLLCWVERDGWLYASTFVFCSTVTVWAHYTLFLGLVPMVWYVFQLGWRRVIIASFSIMLFIFPLIFQIKNVFENRTELYYAIQPTISQIFFSIAPIEIIFLIIFGIIIVIIQLPKHRYIIKKIYTNYPVKRSIIPILLLAILPTLIILLWGIIDGNSMFVRRYMISKELGLAIVAAWLVRGIAACWARLMNIFLLGLFFFSVNALWINSHGPSDWRGSSEWVNDLIEKNHKTSIVLASGFIESMQTKYLNDPLRKEMLFAPQMRYPISSNCYYFPMKPNDEAERRILEDLLPTAKDQEQILIVAGLSSISYKEWFKEYLQRERFILKIEKKFEKVYVWLFCLDSK